MIHRSCAAAYFDLGVEHGIAAARTTAVAGGRKMVNALAQRIVRDLMRTGVASGDVVAALVVAAWALLEGKRVSSPRA